MTLICPLAKNLVRKVHDIQGRTRDGKSRLPGATDENPLGGGLRIGKEGRRWVRLRWPVSSLFELMDVRLEPPKHGRE